MRPFYDDRAALCRLLLPCKIDDAPGIVLLHLRQKILVAHQGGDFEPRLLDPGLIPEANSTTSAIYAPPHAGRRFKEIKRLSRLRLAEDRGLGLAHHSSLGVHLLRYPLRAPNVLPRNSPSIAPHMVQLKSTSLLTVFGQRNFARSPQKHHI
jgi:hypothetical protein